MTLLKAGIYTTVQDHGRFMGAHYGIPCSGPMDRQSADLANLMLGNDINDAILECTYVGPTIQFHKPTIIAVKGAEATVMINELKIDATNPIQILGDDILSFGRFEKGCRIYIAVSGGIQSNCIYESRSVCTTAGILQLLKKNDQLNYNPNSQVHSSSISIKRTIGNRILSAFPGPEFEILNKTQQKQLQNTEFKILPSSNRMAYRVYHEIDLSHDHSILSSGTMPGTIQLTSSGEIICLMRDCQTTGGYPRILQLSEKSINDLSQLMPSQLFTIKID